MFGRLSGLMGTGVEVSICSRQPCKRSRPEGVAAFHSTVTWMQSPGPSLTFHEGEPIRAKSFFGDFLWTSTPSEIEPLHGMSSHPGSKLQSRGACWGSHPRMEWGKERNMEGRSKDM